MKKLISVLLAVLMMASCFAGLSLNASAAQPEGWYYNSEIEQWLYYENGSYVASDWRKIGGKWYYFDYDGWMLCGTIEEIDGDYYYFNASGAMLTGWIKRVAYYSDYNTDIYWYYAYSNGKLADGWAKISGTWYYFDLAMETGSINIDGKIYAFNKSGAWISKGWGQDSWGCWYYVGSKGTCLTGWQKIGGTWYYFDTYDGRMYYGQWSIDDKDYFFTGSGAWVEKPANGWNSATVTLYNSNGKSYKYTEWAYYQNGKAVKGWKKLSGKWYYFNTEHGNMIANGSYDVNDAFYYFNKDGSLREKQGWIQDVDYDGTKYSWYYVNSDGTCAIDWQQIGGKWYYFGYSGEMFANSIAEDEDDYFFLGSDGAMVTKVGWVSIKEIGYNGKTYTTWYYVEDSVGRLAKGWRVINGTSYYFDTEYAYMYANGEYEIGGDWYTFDKSGACIGVG